MEQVQTETFPEQQLEEVKQFLVSISRVRVPVGVLRRPESCAVIGCHLMKRSPKALTAVPPITARKFFLHARHYYSGHWGEKTTNGIITEHVCRPSLARDIGQYMSSCCECQIRVPAGSVDTRLSQPVFGLFHMLSIDFASLLPGTRRENRYILLVLEHLSGWRVVRATKSRTSDLTVRFFRGQVLRQFGSPKVVLTDAARPSPRRYGSALPLKPIPQRR